MTDPLAPAKSDLRRLLRAKRRQRTSAEWAAASLRVQEFLQHTFSHEQTVIFYHALPDEIDLAQLAREWMNQGRTIAFPAVITEERMVFRKVSDLEQSFVPGYRGIFEPGENCLPISAEGALVLVPGLAFTSRGERLGRGKGYYDRALASCRCTPVGISLDEDILPRLPCAEHDVQMSYICTERRLIRCSL